MTMITLCNDFHNTTAVVRSASAWDRANDTERLTRAQRAMILRVRRKLCGVRGCTCGIVRGPQPARK